ncbi:MAG: ParB N-terminal domain-containing protein [Actinomycetota bacterium]|nr:ParB N-terminal domain-containing protein [Rubrobacter sp.]MDQ3509635.1 ParB N-terminal domain-containing protein [Actinomycetota bacterium]
MTPAAELDGLHIVELSRLMLHESHDPNRLSRLRERMASEGVQSNPVIASSYEDDFLVLDGAHRVHALTELGLELALVQIIEVPDRAESWRHLVNGSSLAGLERLEGVEISPRSAGGFTAEIEAADGRLLSVKSETPGDLASEVEVLWRLQSLYPKSSTITRVEPGEEVALSEGEALVRYRSFSTSELVEIVARDTVLPAGITRFHVPRRVLGVRFPLDFLKGRDADFANSELRSLVERHRREHRIRRYDEPITLFE